MKTLPGDRDFPAESFAQAGVVKVRNIVPAASLQRLRATIRTILETELQRIDEQFRAPTPPNDPAPPDDFHDRIMWTAKNAPIALTRTINTIMQTASFLAIACDQRIIQEASKLLFGRADDIASLAVAELNFRVDLPSEFTSLERQFSLSWHQESGYFRDYVSHSQGLVLWIPVFDTGQLEGAIQVVPGSHREGHVSHEAVFMDPVNMRNKRQFLPERTFGNLVEHSIVVEAKAGDAIFMDFNLIHATGKNANSRNVRCTIQARISNLLAPDFGCVPSAADSAADL